MTRATTPFTAAEEAIVRRMREQGRSMDAIAAELPGRSLPSVRSFAYRAGIGLPEGVPPERERPLDRDVVIAALRLPLSNDRRAARLGVSIKKLRKDARRYGLWDERVGVVRRAPTVKAVTAKPSAKPVPAAKRGAVLRPVSVISASAPRTCCQWPHGDPGEADFRFCGQPATRRSYCQTHHEIAYRQPGTDEYAQHMSRLNYAAKHVAPHINLRAAGR